MHYEVSYHCTSSHVLTRQYLDTICTASVRKYCETTTCIRTQKESSVNEKLRREDNYSQSCSF